MILTKYFYVFLIALACPVAISAEIGDSEISQALKRDLSDDKFVEHVRRIREIEIRTLIQVLQSEDIVNETRVNAVLLLGLSRDPSGIGPLIKYIDRLTPTVFFLKTFEAMYPCVFALTEIGKPASQPIIDELRTAKNESKRTLLVYVLKNIEGVKTAQHLINEDLLVAKTEEEKMNLKSALDNSELKGSPEVPK